MPAPMSVESCRVMIAMSSVLTRELNQVRPGVTTDDLDRIGHEFLLDHDAYPSTLGYRGFP